MQFLKEIFGLFLIFVAWFNFFDLSLPVRILAFILGFDMVGIPLKISIFAISYFGFFPYLPGFSNLAFTILILVAIDILLTFLLIGFIVNLILKPIAIIFVAIIAGFDFQLALILGAIDFILNINFKK